MRRILFFLSFIAFVGMPFFVFGIERPDIKINQESIFNENHSSVTWTTTLRGDCWVYFSRERDLSSAREFRGRVFSTVPNPERDGELISYRAELNGDVDPNNEYSYYVSCRFPEYSENLLSTGAYVKDTQDAWDLKYNPVISTYKEETQGTITIYIKATYDRTCWAQYDSSSDDFLQGYTAGTSLVELPTTGNGNKYVYKAIVPGVLPDTLYYLRPECSYSGKTYTGSTVTLKTQVKTLNPILNTDVDPVVSGNNKIVTFNWWTNVDSRCEAIFTVDGQSFAVPTTQKKISDSKYTHEAVGTIVSLGTDYYWRASCFAGTTKLSTAWKKIELITMIQPKIIFKSFAKNSQNLVSFKWTTKVDATCDSLFSQNSNYSEPSIVSATKTKVSDSEYLYESLVPILPNVKVYYMNGSCKYGESLLETDWKKLELTTVVPAKSTFKSFVKDSQNLVSFKWTTNVEATCSSVFSQNANYSQPSGVSATKTKISDSEYLYESILATLPHEKVYYMKGSCQYGESLIETDWQKLELTTVVPETPFTIIMDLNARVVRSDQTSLIKFETTHEAYCYALVSQDADFSTSTKFDASYSGASGTSKLYLVFATGLKLGPNYYTQAFCKYNNKEYKTHGFIIVGYSGPVEDKKSVPKIDGVRFPSHNSLLVTIKNEWESNACGVFISSSENMTSPSSVGAGLASRPSGDLKHYTYHSTTFDVKPNGVYYYQPFCTLASGKVVNGGVIKVVVPNVLQKKYSELVTVDLVYTLDGTVVMKFSSNFKGSCFVQVSKSDKMDPFLQFDAKLLASILPVQSDQSIIYEVIAKGLDTQSIYYYRPYCNVDNEKVIGSIKWFSTPKKETSSNGSVEKVNLINKDILSGEGVTQKLETQPVIMRVHADEIREKANKLTDDSRVDQLLKDLNVLRNQLKEKEVELKYLKKLVKAGQELNAQMEEALTKFIAYGADEKTKKQGEGQRSSVLSSFSGVYGRLPETDTELSDVILLTRGEAPLNRNYDAEKKSYEEFIKIYKRIPDFSDIYDANSIHIMTYGMLNGGPRDIQSEKNAQGSFKNIYGKLPTTTEEWNYLRAITYSGATRKPDTDKDLLPDYLEKKLGTNHQVADTDNDGFSDGREFLNGYNPLGNGRI